jgi:phospholipid-binding lipoprotein MlaA
MVALLLGVATLLISACGTVSGRIDAAPAVEMPQEPEAPPRDLRTSEDAGAASTSEDSLVVEEMLSAFPAGFEEPEDTGLAGLILSTRMIAQAAKPAPGPDEEEILEEYDPWEPFNQTMFEFNRQLDRWVIKPVATVYDKVMPDELKQMIARGFDNIRVVPRVVNNLLQGKFEGAGREVARFLINSVAGIGGLWDMAFQEFGLAKSPADFGQTLGKWGITPGPYLVLPFFPPSTVRDAIGRAADGAMNPLDYFIPLIWEGLSIFVGETVNERALNLELFQGFEETTLDLYSSVRNAYLQRRARQIQE